MTYYLLFPLTLMMVNILIENYLGVYALEAPPGHRFVRSYSRHKL